MKLTLIFFSPTRTTQKILKSIAKGMQADEIETINLTKPENRTKNYTISSDFCLVGVPDYEARVPPLMRETIKKLQGNNTPTAALIVYGNRTLGIALKQLVGLLDQQNFKILATGSFVAEHSYANSQLPIALGRPNEEDLSLAETMGQEIIEKKVNWPSSKGLSEKDIGGKIKQMFKLLPEGFLGSFGKPGNIIESKCTQCKACVQSCPTASIDPESLTINRKTCIHCMACVKFCPEDARPIKYKSLSVVKKFMKPAISQSRSPRYEINIKDVSF